MSRWHWERSDENALFPSTVTSFVDGGNEWYGVLEAAPPVVAEVFAQEFIQNFADAADELARTTDGAAGTPALEFRFL